MTTSFAEWLKGRMELLGLKTYEAAAAHLGLHEQSIYNYMSGRSLPPASRVDRIAKDLGVDPAELEQVLAVDREARRCGIPIDTPAQTLAALDRLKASRAADHLEKLVERHAQEDDGDDGAYAPHDGPCAPHVVEPTP